VLTESIELTPGDGQGNGHGTGHGNGHDSDEERDTSPARLGSLAHHDGADDSAGDAGA